MREIKKYNQRERDIEKEMRKGMGTRWERKRQKGINIDHDNDKGLLADKKKENGEEEGEKEGDKNEKQKKNDKESDK